MKIYTIIAEGICDCNDYLMTIKNYISEPEARKCFAEQVVVSRKEAKELGWEVKDDDEYCFSAGEDGYYVQSHVSVSLNEQNVPVHSWQLQEVAESKALAEIRELLAKTPNKEWHFGHDYCGEDGGGDIPFVNAHNVMQDDSISKIGIDAICIDKKNKLVALYHVCNEETDADQFSDYFEDVVKSQDYHIVAKELHDAMKNYNDNEN